MLMGATHNALRAFNARVSLTCLCFVAHKLPRLFFGPVWIARSWEVMAYRPSGSAQTECIRLPYAAPEASHRAFFFKVQPQPMGNGNRERVSCFRFQGRVCQFILTME